jgi:hypothetical protein
MNLLKLSRPHASDVFGVLAWCKFNLENVIKALSEMRLHSLDITGL